MTEKFLQWLLLSPWVSRAMLVTIIGILMFGFWKVTKLLIQGKLESMKIENAAQKAAIVALGEQHSMMINELVLQRTNHLSHIQDTGKQQVEILTDLKELQIGQNAKTDTLIDIIAKRS